MSYRGKKLKRTKLEVMRDIIEEYTKEKKVGGIGCFLKGVEEEMPVTYDHAADADEHVKGTDNISEAASNRRKSHYDQHSRSTRFDDYSRNSFDQSRRHEQRDLEDQMRIIGKEKHREDRQSGISKRHISHKRECDDAESTRGTNYERGSRSSSSKNKDYKSSYYVSNSSDGFHLRKDDLKLDSRDQYRRSENHISGSRAQNRFDDRYNPSESKDIYDNDVHGGKYVRSE